MRICSLSILEAVVTRRAVHLKRYSRKHQKIRISPWETDNIVYIPLGILRSVRHTSNTSIVVLTFTYIQFPNLLRYFRWWFPDNLTSNYIDRYLCYYMEYPHPLSASGKPCFRVLFSVLFQLWFTQKLQKQIFVQHWLHRVRIPMQSHGASKLASSAVNGFASPIGLVYWCLSALSHTL